MKKLDYILNSVINEHLKFRVNIPLNNQVNRFNILGINWDSYLFDKSGY